MNHCSPLCLACRRGALALAAGWLLATGAAAQETGSDEVGVDLSTEDLHWAYSAFLGTGFYRVSGDRKVFVIEMPLSSAWRTAEISDSGERTLGVTWDYGVTLGMHRLDFFDDFLDPENFGTISVAPGVTLDYLLSDRWVLRGFGHFGWGTEISGDEDAWLWDVGLKSRYAFAHDTGRGTLDWGVMGEVFHAGYNPGDARSGGLSGFGLAVDFRHPISWRAMDDGPLDVTWDLTYRWYGDELTFRGSDRQRVSIGDEWRGSLAIARRDRSICLWFVCLDQLGLSYRTSSDRKFRGITLNVSGPLDR